MLLKDYETIPGEEMQILLYFGNARTSFSTYHVRLTFFDRFGGNII